MSELHEKVKEINKKLESFGKEAVQKKNVGGRTQIGYKPQYVIDAVNEVLGAENWWYEKMGDFVEHAYKTQSKKDATNISCLINVRFRVGDKLYETGLQAGTTDLYHEKSGNWGDAYKSAITNAVTKCLARLSIGSKAYRGLLKDPDEMSSKPSKVMEADDDFDINELPALDDDDFDEFLA